MTAMLSNNDFSRRLVAHRGWRQQYPENSYAGIEAALKLGIRHIEIDIHITADVIPVVCHDHHLMRLCQQDSDIRQNTLAQLQHFSFHEASRLAAQFYPTPLLSLAGCVALVAQYPQATLYAEIKRKSLYHFGRKTVLHAINQVLKPIHSQTALVSFDLAILQLAQSQHLPYPLMPILLNQEQAHSTAIKQLKPAVIFCNCENIHPQQDLSALPYPTVVYDVGDYTMALDFLNRGAHLIETFDCGGLLAANAQAV